MKPNRTIVFTANTSWYLFNFRMSLAKRMQSKGYRVVCAAPRDDFSSQLESAGFTFCEWSVIRAGMNPFREILALMQLWRLYKQERPELVHHFTIKAVLYGSVAARLSGVRGVVNSVTGMGHVFIDSSLLKRTLRAVLRLIYRQATAGSRFIFQNPDDRDFFISSGLVSPERVTLVKGSGVDMTRFTPAEPRDDRSVLFVGRLIREKGIYEFLEAAKLVKKAMPDARILVAGNPDEGNPSSLTPGEQRELADLGIAEFLGHVERMEELLSRVRVVVLPSYREGLPRVLLEAGAMERALVATNVPGCREVVLHGKTGLLVPPGNVGALGEAMLKLLGEPELSRRLGKSARTFIDEQLSDKVILEQTEKVYELSLSHA